MRCVKPTSQKGRSMSIQSTGDSDGNQLPAFIVDSRGCWIWTRGTRKGYAVRRDGTNKSAGVHRLNWEAFNGPVPDGLVMDHLCRVKCCVNPDHLEAVTTKENKLRGFGVPAMNARKSHCKHGHLLAGDNLESRRHPNGSIHRTCISCHRNWWRRVRR